MIPTFGYKHTVEDYNIVIYCAAKSQDTRTMLLYYKRMLQEKIEANHYTYNAMMYGYSKKNEENLMMDVLEIMQVNTRDSIGDVPQRCQWRLYWRYQ
jgi:pentatricopeptide repeat protein